MKHIECSGTDEVVCPYCGHEHSDSWEWFRDNGHDVDIDCATCGKTFRASPDYSVTYFTYQLTDEGEKRQ